MKYMIFIILGNLATGLLFTSYYTMLSNQAAFVSLDPEFAPKKKTYLFGWMLNGIINKSNKRNIHILFLVLTVILCMLTKSFIFMFIYFIFLSLYWMFVYSQKRKISQLFQKNAYKLYRYLISQISAGVLAKDAILQMYTVCADKQLYSILSKATASYSLDLKGATFANVLRKEINTVDADRFALILEEDLLYKDNENFLEKMEEMMFNRYFSYHTEKTQKVKKYSFAAVGIFMIIVLLITVLPLLEQLRQGLSNIF